MKAAVMTTTMNKVTLYSDLNQYEELQTDSVFNIEAIYQSIHNILATKKRERLFNPEFGSLVDNYLFEPIDDVTSLGLYSVITDAIHRWEPRVRILHHLSSVSPFPEEHLYKVVLVFQVVGLQGDYNYTTDILSRFGES